MALDPRDLDQLVARLGRENVLHSEADRLVYSTDVGSPPAIVDLLVNRKADAVARCHTIEDVQTVVQFCRKRRIPMTPRAAATNALGGAVPKRGGVVIDLTGMRRDVTIDEARATVTVDAGVVVKDLQDKLLEVGLELPTYPTSALAATIGGFVAMDGHGIHATRAGNIGKWVVDIEGVGTDGHVFHARDDDEQAFYLGLGGSTGIITRITLRVVETTPDKPVLVTVKRERDLTALLEEATTRFPLKHATFRNADFYALRAEATKQRKNPMAGKTGVLFCFSEKDWGQNEDAFRRMVERLGGEVADDKLAATEWDERFYPIKSKRLGPSLVAGEVFVPLGRVGDYLRAVRDKVSVKEFAAEGHVTDDGRAYLFLYTPDDERRPNYPAAWGTSEWFLHIADQMGGRPYHCGVWLQWHAKKVFGARRYKRLKSFKNQGDNRNLMNPGMVFPLPAPVPEFVHKMAVAGPVPAPSLGFQLWAGGPMLRYFGGSVRHRRHKTLGVQAADVAADMARGDGILGLHSELIWGADTPSLQAIPNPGDLPMTQTPRGKLTLTRAFVSGNLTDPWALKPAFDVADPEVEDATMAPEYAEVKEILDATRQALVAEGVELDVKTVKVEAPSEATLPEAGAKAEAKPGLDVEAIKKQAAATPEVEKAWVLAADCIVCNGCESACPTAAAIVTDMARVDRDLCIADGACFDACPTGAIRPGEEDASVSAGWPEGSRLAGKFGV